MKTFFKRYSTFSVGGAAIVLAAVAGGCMKESFYSNTKRFDTYAQTTAADKMDFLWVIDNSPTMAGKIDFVLKNVSDLMTEIVKTKDLDWTASIITTDLTYIGSAAGTYLMTQGKGFTGTAPIVIDRLPYFDAWIDGPGQTNTVTDEFCDLGDPSKSTSGPAGTVCLNRNSPSTSRRFMQNTLKNYNTWRYVTSGPNKVANFPAPFRRAAGRPDPEPPAPPLPTTPGGGSYQSGIAEFAQMLRDFKPEDCIFTGSIPLGVICGHMNTPFSYWEEGLEYIYKMLVDPTLLSLVSRVGVPLSVIVLSDANDYSCDTANDPNGCSGGSPEDQTPQPIYYPVSRYINTLTNIKKSESSYVNFFAIVSTKSEDQLAPGSGGCFAESIGDRYMQVAKALNDKGFVGNVCTLTGSGLANSALAQVADILRDRGKLFPLSSIPDGYQGLSVLVNGVAAVPQVDYELKLIGERCFVSFITNIPNNGDDVSIDYQSGQTAGSCP